MSKRKFEGLGNAQKLAIIGAAAILVIVLGAALLLDDPQIANSQSFSDFLFQSPKSGIIMDIRNSPSPEYNSVVMQCGVNLISGGFFAKADKDLLVYACDNSGCLSSEALQNSTNGEINGTETNASAVSVPFDEALYNMRSRAYFHIQYAPEEYKKFHSTYVEVFVNSSTDTSQCRLGITKN